MDKKLIAYNSKALRVVFVICDVIMLAFTILSIWPLRAGALITVLLAFGFVGMTIVTIRFLLDKSSIAFECDEENLVLYRNDKKTNIPLSEIIEVSINEMDNFGGSFDATIHTLNKKYVMHMLIKNRNEVYEQFIEVLKGKGIKIRLREVSIGGD